MEDGENSGGVRVRGSQVRRYGLKILSFRNCYIHNFEKFPTFRTSALRLVVRRYGGAEMRTEVRNCPALLNGITSPYERIIDRIAWVYYHSVYQWNNTVAVADW